MNNSYSLAVLLDRAEELILTEHGRDFRITRDNGTILVSCGHEWRRLSADMTLEEIRPILEAYRPGAWND
jgi:hypothetical protein